jgi:hypothetical protein
MRKILISLAAMLALSACSYLPWKQTAAPDVPVVEKPSGPLVDFAAERATQSERADCETKGGRVERAGLLGWERCTRSFTDGGKICTDSAQCQGQCRAEAIGAPREKLTGRCTANDNPFGCYATVQNGMSAGMLCVD